MLLLNMFKIQGFLSVNLLGQVVTSRGQILVNSTGDNTLRVLCCALFVVCVVGVQCVGVGVCWCWCWCWCVTLISTSTLSTPLLSPCVRAKRPRVYRHHARKTPHRTHTPRPQKHTHKRQQPPQHTETGTERDRERRKRKCREDERLEKRRSRDKKREDERREKTREEKMKDKRRWREKRREEERWKRRWKREWRETEMKRDERKDDCVEKCLWTPKSQVNQPCFEIKSLSGKLFFFSSNVQNLTVFSIICMILIRFFGFRESFQLGFRTAQYLSGRESLMTRLSRETGASGNFDTMFSCHDVFSDLQT